VIVKCHVGTRVVQINILTYELSWTSHDYCLIWAHPHSDAALEFPQQAGDLVAADTTTRIATIRRGPHATSNDI
jgi:hypothetical protein